MVEFHFTKTKEKRKASVPSIFHAEIDSSEGLDRPISIQQLQEQGNQFAEAGNYDKAIQVWQRAINRDESVGVLYELQAQALLELDRPFEAIKKAILAVERLPEWMEGYLTLARAHCNFGELDSALKNLNIAKELDPSNDEIKEELDYVGQLLAKRDQLQRSHEQKLERLTDAAAREVCSCKLNLSRRCKRV